MRDEEIYEMHMARRWAPDSEERNILMRDNSLVGSGHADKAAIVSAAGDSVWAKSADFEVRTPTCIGSPRLGAVVAGLVLARR